MKPQFYFPLAAALGLLLPPASGAQSVHVKSAAGITVRLDESSGRYEIVSRRPDLEIRG